MPAELNGDDSWAVMLGTFPPTRCGLATFTAHTRSSILDANPSLRLDVVRVMKHPDDQLVAQSEVRAIWTPNDDPGEIAAACNNADVVLIQHEFGIYPGINGSDIIGFVDGLNTAVISILHTVLEHPSTQQHRIIEHLIDRSEYVVVLGQTAADRLDSGHSINPARLRIIPHGAEVHESCWTRTDPRRVSAHGPWTQGSLPTVLSWGLLGPGKGLEDGIDAVAELTRRGIALRYIIAGQVHPSVRAVSGDEYRVGLEQRAAARGIEHEIIFDDRYRSDGELRALIASADVVLLPYENRDQVTSGVLVEALAAGKPVVATAFPHALEVVADQAGITVDSDDPADIHRKLADGLEALLADRGRYQMLRLGAQRIGREHAWPRVGAQYNELINTVGSTQAVST
jgi:glycosyltransferase involved in cell wall biosynthesis